jgi:hypothetical protein
LVAKKKSTKESIEPKTTGAMYVPHVQIRVGPAALVHCRRPEQLPVASAAAAAAVAAVGGGSAGRPVVDFIINILPI